MEFAEGSTFVGRAEPLDRLTAIAGRAREGQPAIVLITGEAGIGKSRLVAEWLAQLQRDGALVLFGTCPPVAGVDLPLAAVIQALRSLRRRVSQDEDTAVLGPSMPVLGRLAPSLGAAGASDPGPISISLLFEHILGVLERLAERHPLVVLAVDDLQWGGPTTWDLLAHLANNLIDVPVLVVATVREDAIAKGGREDQILAELKRRPSVDVMDLQPLEADEARQLVASATPELDDHAGQSVVSAANGNPLILRELAVSAAAGIKGIPETIRGMLLARLATQPNEVVHVLRTASAIGRDTDAELLIAASGLDEATALAALRESVRSSFLVRSSVDEGSFAFGQDVVRQVVYEDLIPGERARIHGAVARALAGSRDAIRDVDRAVELAAHWQASGDAVRAVPALLQAADAAERAYAFVEAYRLYEQAFSLLDEAEPVRERQPIGFQPATASRSSDWAGLRARAAESASLAGEPERALEHIDAAIEGGRPADGSDQRWRARRARYLVEAGRTGESLAEYERLVSGSNPADAELPRTLVAYARALAGAGRHREAAEAGGRALERARATGQQTEEWQALTLVGTARAYEGDLTSALQMLSEARNLSSQRPTGTMLRPRPTRIGELLSARLDAVRALDHAGRPVEAAAMAAEIGEDADRLGAARWGAERELAAARQAYLAGSWEECRRRCDAILTDAAAPTASEARVIRARLSAGQGDWVAAEADLEAVEQSILADRRPDLVTAFYLAAAEVATWQRRLHEAANVLDQGLGLLASAEDRLARAELGAWALRVAVERIDDSRIRRGSPEATGHGETARRLLAETRALIEGMDSPRALAIGATSQAEAARAGDGEDVVGAWQAAVAASEAIPEPYAAAYGRWRLSEAMLGAGEARRDAGVELRLAHASARALSAAPLLREIDRLAARARIDLEADGPTEPAPTPEARPDLGLSERELEVLALVALGRTNRQIAEALFITEKTAGHHVSNILAKLDVANRLEAAAIAHRAGLTPE